VSIDRGKGGKEHSVEGKKRKGRGVLASLLSMGSGDQDVAPDDDGPVFPPIPADLTPADPDERPNPFADTAPSGIGGQPVRESYEPGWYRISLARNQHGDEQTEFDSADAADDAPPEETSEMPPAAGERPWTEQQPPAWQEPPDWGTSSSPSSSMTPGWDQPTQTEEPVAEDQPLTWEKPASWQEPSQSWEQPIGSWEEPDEWSPRADFPIAIEAQDETTTEDPQDQAAIDDAPAVEAAPVQAAPVEAVAVEAVAVQEAPVEEVPDAEVPAAEPWSLAPEQDSTGPVRPAWGTPLDLPGTPAADAPSQQDLVSPVPEGMREAYEPSWYRITLAQKPTPSPAQPGETSTDTPFVSPAPDAPATHFENADGLLLPEIAPEAGAEDESKGKGRRSLFARRRAKKLEAEFNQAEVAELAEAAATDPLPVESIEPETPVTAAPPWPVVPSALQEQPEYASEPQLEHEQDVEEAQELEEPSIEQDAVEDLENMDDLEEEPGSFSPIVPPWAREMDLETTGVDNSLAASVHDDDDVDAPEIAIHEEDPPIAMQEDFAAASSYEPPSPSLISLSAEDRRTALEELRVRGVTEDDVTTISALVSDPERDIRALAVETLAEHPELVDPDVVRRGLQDPTDEVRAATVRLAAAQDDPDLDLLCPMVAARRWPLTQQTALDVLPGLFHRGPADDRALDALLTAVASMESSPIGDERSGFGRLTRSVGIDRLIESLDLPDDRRLGAVRLLLEDGSPEALRAVSEQGRDPLDEVRVAATSAKDQLIAAEPEVVVEPEPVPEPEPEPEEDLETVLDQPVSAFAQDAGIATAGPVESEIISGLAHALEDPDEGVRERAARALGEVDRSALLTWTREALQSSDPAEASLAGAVAEAATLHEVAGDILDRASGIRPEARGSLVGALSSLGLEDRELVALAGSVEVSRRPDAVRLLWQVAGRRVLSPLRTMLEDSSGPVRVSVLEVFGESGDPSAIEVAHSVLEHDSSPVVRATAIQVIGRAGLDQRTQSLQQALEDPDPDVRSTAVELLPQGMAGQAGELLLIAMQDEDERVWQPAMRHLVSLPERDLPVLWKAIRSTSEERREQLISLLERTSHERLGLVALEHLSSPDYDDRMLAISLASRSGTPGAVQGVIGTLVDPLPAVRRAGAASLAQLASPEAIPALSQALNDPDRGVREEALRALSDIDDERVLDPLINALKDPEASVREVASDALIRWSSPAVARRLVEALTSPVLRRPASELLARMGTSAVDPLVNLLRDGHPDIAATVGDTLERLVGREVFLERLGSMDPDERMGAVEALGAMGGLEAIEGLVRALSDPNEDIRIRSLQLLGDLGDPRGIDAVERSAHGDPVPEVAAAAEETLRRLQGP
jgi:HEAT repeat protein